MSAALSAATVRHDSGAPVLETNTLTSAPANASRGRNRTIQVFTPLISVGPSNVQNATRMPLPLAQWETDCSEIRRVSSSGNAFDDRQRGIGDIIFAQVPKNVNTIAINVVKAFY